MIRYIGKKHLDSNFYSRITLQQENDFIKVRTLPDEKSKNILLTNKHTKTVFAVLFSPAFLPFLVSIFL